MTSQEGMSVEQLAAETGVSVRNIRYYQELGLIEAPLRQGRVAVYGRSQVAALRRIAVLREEGLSLEAVGRLLRSTDGGQLRFMQTLLDDASNEAPLRIPLEQLRARFGQGPAPAIASGALETSFFRALDDGEVEVRSPALLRIGEELDELDVPLSDAVALLSKLEQNLGEIAESYIELFLQRVWRPAIESGREVPWEQLEQTLVRLRGLAGESVGVAFAVLMRDATERARVREMQGAVDAAAPADTAGAPVR